MAKQRNTGSNRRQGTQRSTGSRTSNRSKGSNAGTRRARGSSDGGSTRQELYEQARRMDIQGRSRMNKAELQRAVQRSRR